LVLDSSDRAAEDICRFLFSQADVEPEDGYCPLTRRKPVECLLEFNERQRIVVAA
jgi:hypothetical protein